MASVGMNIYLMDPDGSNVTRLTRSRGSSNQPAWSPDGRRIAFTSDRDFDWHIYAMDSDGYEVCAVWQSMTERAMWVYARAKCESIQKERLLVGMLCSYA